MIHKNIKLLVVVALVGLAIWQITERHVGNGIFIIIIALIVLLFYFKNEILIMTLFKLRKQDMDGAKKMLDKIKNPKGALLKKQEGYYNYLNGIVVSQNNLTQAEKFFKRAIELGLNQKEDLAVAKLQLAGIAMSRRRKVEATRLLNEAQKLDTKNMLKDQVKMMKQQMKRI
ncbi:MAG TPA: hypothetical protein VKY32_05305 [Flavobacterium sp.]|nr:hypothetical protein [Flavobacterium sp.]